MHVQQPSNSNDHEQFRTFGNGIFNIEENDQDLVEIHRTILNIIHARLFPYKTISFHSNVLSNGVENITKFTTIYRSMGLGNSPKCEFI